MTINRSDNRIPGKARELSRLMEFDEFICRAEGKSERTIELTRLALCKLKLFLEETGLPDDLDQIGPQEMRAFILYLKDSRRFTHHPYVKPHDSCLSEHTVNTYLRAIRAAWNRWVDEGLLRSSPFERVRLPKPPEKVKPPLSSEQLEALLAAVDLSSPQGYRDVTLICVLADTVSRLSEISDLRMENLDLPGRCMKIMGKGRKERVVPFGVKAQKLLYKYIQFYRPPPLHPGDNCVFLTYDGRRLTKNRVEAIVRKYARKAGLENTPCSPHSLRRTGCVRWVLRGGDVFSLQKMTGHKSLNVLRGYVELAQSDIRAAHARYSPIDNLGTEN